MNREERRIYQLGVAFAAVMIIAMTSVLTEECGKKTVYAAAEVVDGNFIDGTATSPEKGQIREDSGMPCENREQFERWYANYVTSERTESTERIDAECVPFQQIEEVQMETETKMYAVGESILNPELQALLYDALDRHGISYFFELACVQCYQESHFNVWAENPNGRDKGILQYRLQYWDWNRGDIFDPAAQFELYAEQMAARLNAGLSADECISRHNTSDFVTAVNWEYVAQCKQWLSQMEAIR